MAKALLKGRGNGQLQGKGEGHETGQFQGSQRIWGGMFEEQTLSLILPKFPSPAGVPLNVLYFPMIVYTLAAHYVSLHILFLESLR